MEAAHKYELRNIRNCLISTFYREVDWCAEIVFSGCKNVENEHNITH